MQTTGPAWVRPTADYGPLAAFFIAYLIGGLFVATAALMAGLIIVPATRNCPGFQDFYFNL